MATLALFGIMCGVMALWYKAIVLWKGKHHE